MYCSVIIYIYFKKNSNSIWVLISTAPSVEHYTRIYRTHYKYTYIHTYTHTYYIYINMGMLFSIVMLHVTSLLNCNAIYIYIWTASNLIYHGWMYQRQLSNLHSWPEVYEAISMYQQLLAHCRTHICWRCTGDTRILNKERKWCNF